MSGRIGYIAGFIAFISLLASCSEQEAYYIGSPDTQWAREPVEMAVEEINASGGIDGKPLKVIFEPYQSDQGLALAAVDFAEKMIADERILAVVGQFSSIDSLSAAHLYNAYKIVNLVPWGTNPLLTQVGPWIFRLCVNDIDQGRLLAEVAFEDLKAEKISVVFANTDYGKLLAKSFIDNLERLGRQICYIGWLDREDVDTLKLIVNHVIKNNCDLIFFAGPVAFIPEIVNEIESAGSGTKLLVGDTGYTYEIARQMAEMNSSVQVIFSTFFNPKSSSEKTVEFIDKYSRKYDHPPNPVNALMYDATYVIATAIRDGGVTREKLRRELSLIGNDDIPFEGVTGKIRLFENGECERKVWIATYDDNLSVLREAVLSPLQRQGAGNK